MTQLSTSDLDGNFMQLEQFRNSLRANLSCYADDSVESVILILGLKLKIDF